MAKRTISGSRAIVTGASSGIGRAIAIELGRRGADVVLTARREEQLQQTVAEFDSHPGRARYVAGDITDAAVRQRCVDLAAGELGGLDILVNDAGVGALGRFERADADRLRRIMDVNFFAAAEMIRAALPLLRRGRRPIVVNVGSILGHRGVPHSSEYCASKFALQGFSQSLRAEFSRIGIDVLVVSPGTTDTEFHGHSIERDSHPPWIDKHGTPAAAVARATVGAIASGRHEIIPSRDGRWLCWAQRFCPWIVDRWMQRYG